MINVLMVKTDATCISFQCIDWMEVVTRCIRYKSKESEIHKTFVCPSPQDPGISEYPVEQMEQDFLDGWIPEPKKSKT